MRLLLALILLTSCARHYPASPQLPDVLRVTYLQVTVSDEGASVRYVEAGDQTSRYKTIQIERVK